MSSIQSPIPFDTHPSPQSLDNLNTDSNESEKDEICMICKEWCHNCQDLEFNFISCKSCAHSYHKQCIPIIYHTQDPDESYNCNEMKNKNTNQPLTCCADRKPFLLYEISGNEFDKTNYIYNSNGIQVAYNPNCDAIKHQLFLHKNNNNRSNQIFSKRKCSALTYKGIDYQIGDSIEIQSENRQPFHTKVAIIKEIHVYEEEILPRFSIFWYWREREIKNNLYNLYGGTIKLLQIPNKSTTDSERKCMDNHLYLDIENEELISISSVLHRIIISDDFDNFSEIKDLKFKQFGNVFYCNCSFTMENYTKYQSSPFERINMERFKDKLIEISTNLSKNYRAKTKNKHQTTHKKPKNKQKSIDKVEQYLRFFANTYEGNDECVCMDHNVPFSIEEKHSGKLEKKLPLPKGNKLVMEEIDTVPQSFFAAPSHKKKKRKVMKKDILAKNKKVINVCDQDTMRDICDKLGLINGIKIDINLYGYKTHLDVYKDILDLVKISDESERKEKIKDLSGQKLRDIKSKTKSEGKCGRKQEMTEGICKKMTELKINYEKNALEEHESVVEDIDVNMEELKENKENKPKKRKRPRFEVFNKYRKKVKKLRIKDSF